MRAVDVHGFGGGFTLGAVQAGFELANKYSLEVGFGVYNTLGNRPLLGHGWDSVVGALDPENRKLPPRKWHPVEAELVMGNPPCSGFSTLTSSAKAKGIDADVNNYMWQLIHFAAMVKPKIVMWESVQQTFRQGLPLLRALHACLEEESGREYDLYHVLHNNASLGGVSIRRRYFWVAIERGLPFGVESCGIYPNGEPYQVTRVPTLGDALGDLAPLGMTLRQQPYRSVTCLHSYMNRDRFVHSVDQCNCSRHGKVRVHNTSWWNEQEIHDGTGLVDGHSTFYSPSLRRVQDLVYQPDLNEYGVPWEEGERLSDVLRKYYQKHGDLPPSWRYPSVDGKTGEATTKDQILIKSDFLLGHHQQVRWVWDRMARVVTGGAVHTVIHPHQARTLSQREVARIQGFPDAWKIWPVRNAPDLGPGWGKGVPVQAGRWGAHWAKQAILEQPGSIRGVPLGEFDKRLAKRYPAYEHERVIDVTNDYKPLTAAIGDPG